MYGEYMYVYTVHIHLKRLIDPALNRSCESYCFLWKSNVD